MNRDNVFVSTAGRRDSMRTVKQVSELTGISVRTLHYYDEIGLFKPSKITESGYRMYNDDALEILQQILFFKELDFPLKDIKAIMLNPKYDKNKAFANQRKLIQIKRDRLDGLLSLLDKLIKGEKCMSFEEFDIHEYISVLENFIKGNTDEIARYGGDLDEFKRVLETLKSDSPLKSEFTQMAIKQYGSIGKFTEAARKNLARFPEIMEQMNSMKDGVSSYIDKSNDLMRQLTANLSKDVSSKEIQKIVGELVAVGGAYSNATDLGENYWGLIADGYLSNPTVIEATDRKYGNGASAFIGEALKAYQGRKANGQ